MKRIVFVISLLSTFVLAGAWSSESFSGVDGIPIDSLRKMYEQPIENWPRPLIDSTVTWSELSALPPDSSWKLWNTDPKIKLGMLLFFDPRLSKSNQISCSSCHEPELAWQDGRKVSLGNNHLQGIRNTQSILNTFIYKELFWDGRAKSYEEQALGPLSAHHEMDVELKTLSKKMSKIKGYIPLFDSAYGSKKITLQRITEALAAFQQTIKSRSSKFDYFVRGRHKALSDNELKGLHLFRTKARCMNCHHGIYFTDQQFHNIGLTYYGRKYQDLGRYDITKNIDDVGKFRTPSLRDVMHTGPWMHIGLFSSMEGIINMYNVGMPRPKPRKDQINDPLFPKTDHLLKPLHLTKDEVQYLVAFMSAISGVPYKMHRPDLPK